MKVLFAIGSAVTSEKLASEYLATYNEKMDYKDVFYFKAILEEVKRDKSYDRIVITEQLEPVQNNVVDEIDKMLFNNIDSITDEVDDTTIIFICSDSRTKNDALIGRLFNLGIYNVLIGDERNPNTLCKLIRTPRTKKEAKEYLRLNPADSETSLKQEDGVNENELLNICRYFDGLRTPEEYIQAFASVKEQYEDKDLIVIVAALTKQLKRGKEIFDAISGVPEYMRYCEWNKEQLAAQKKASGKKNLFGFGKNKNNQSSSKDLKQVVSNRREDDVNPINDYNSNLRGFGQNKAQDGYLQDQLKAQQEAQMKFEEETRRKEEQLRAQEEELKRQEEELIRKQEEEKRLRDEKFKAQQEQYLKAQQEEQIRKQQEELIRKQQEDMFNSQNGIPITPQPPSSSNTMSSEQEELLKQQQRDARIKQQQREAQLKLQQEEMKKQQQEDMFKKQQEDQIRAAQQAELRRQQEIAMLTKQQAQQSQQDSFARQQEALRLQQEEIRRQREELRSQYDSLNQNPISGGMGYSEAPLAYQGDDYDYGQSTPVSSNYKKVVAFVGTNKVGTSFLINCVGTCMALKGIKTAMLDMTKSRGLFWFYENDTRKYRNLVANCMSNLSSGITKPVPIGKNRNLTLFTTVPGGPEENRKGYRHRNVIDAALKDCSLLLVDCDFTTPFEYFEQAHDIFLVQDLDLIKMVDTKEFLKDLKSAHVDWNKLKVVFNNMVPSKITSKKLIEDALSYYTDINETYTLEFEKIRKYVEIPLNPANYVNYIESIGVGRIAYDKFTADFRQAIDELCNMVYTPQSGKKGLFGK